MLGYDIYIEDDYKIPFHILHNDYFNHKYEKRNIRKISMKVRHRIKQPKGKGKK